MPPLLSTSRRAAAALLAALCAALGWIAWKTGVDPETPFLPANPPAAWILYPTPPSTLPQAAVEMDTVFRRAFVLPRQPAAAKLRVRWFRHGAVAVNGVLAAATRPGASWKSPVEEDIARLLRPGENTLEARAENDSGPPALWLSLEAPGFRLVTDEQWEASLADASWRPARRATVPMDEWWSQPRPLGPPDIAANPHPVAAARATLPLLTAFALLGLIPLSVLRAWARRRPAGPLTGRETAVLLAAVAALWGALFWNDRHLSLLWGFDGSAHLEYVRAVLEDHHLPLANEGWEMYQPPLYYLLSAGLLRLTGHATVDAGALIWLHVLGWAAGLLQCGSVLAAIRLLFAERLRPLFAGLCLAVFLPVQLYMFQYISNEGLHAALCSLALWLALRILRRDDLSVRSHTILGIVLGLAMLAKFSALVTWVVIAAVLAGRLAARGIRDLRSYARTVGTLTLAALLVCGWHYARVARHFGRPLVGNWDRDTGFAWWMDPGFATAGTFLRFGRSLTTPLLSAFHGLPDAIYSTLWGDGLLGGASLLTVRPPWNYGLMAAGFLLALLPTAALLLGLVASLVRLVRAPRAEDFLVLGALGGTAFAVLLLSLKLPFYAQAKAFYGLSSLISLCALTGRGFEILSPRSRLASGVLFLLLGVWGLTSYATFWIPRGASGEPSATAVAALDPEGLVGRSEAAARQGRSAAAIELARRATALAPDHPFAWIQLGSSLGRAGESREAIDALREALRIAPRDPQIHGWLARLYATQGDADRVLYHQRLAERLGAVRATP